MPELPEVEVIRRGLAPQLTRRTILQVSWSGQRLRKPVPRRLLKEWIVGVQIRAVDRRAKFLLFRMANQALLVVHLGMTGKLGLLPSGTPSRKHDHLRFRLEGDQEMRFNDVRRFGFLEVYPPGEQDPDPFVRFGPEPFWHEFSAGYLVDRARGRRQPVKNFLMDNRVVVGIGNIYASEILFAARISPFIPANALQPADWQAVVITGRQVLTRAIACGGTTIADFENESGASGRFQNELTVYGRAGHPCPCCQTSIGRRVLAGRATFYCPCCQK